MSRFLDEKFSALKEYVPGEQPRDKKYIKLNTNESPFPPSVSVLEAVNSEEVKNLRLYSDPSNKALKEKLAEIYNPDKFTPAVIEFVDIAGLVKGASKGEGLGNKFLANIRIYQIKRKKSEYLFNRNKKSAGKFRPIRVFVLDDFSLYISNIVS